MTERTDRAGRIRVAVVDDQQLFVYGIRMLVESQPDLELVGSAADGQHAVSMVAETRPDVVLMDLRMPVMGGIEATHHITRREADTGHRARVIILSTFHQREAVFQALKRGASAFLTKDAAPEVVLDTIRQVHAGDLLSARDDIFALVRTFGTTDAVDSPASAIGELTAREREIFLLVAKGLSNSEVAAAAYISEATAKTHVRSILAKLDLQSRVQIVVYAYENRLVV